ncbi:pilus assembly protein [Kineobactrum salinum]|uniref:PilY1 beta-propeller domain-containing protein n=1 Tax=Kineobactrum salinum TaxID=2708301 RepID=A0A6C0U2N7_9GAMM|nr:PilC/PilY family type IV pilus protein [Kineobactrum salinum]QIB66351.1 hypothetical protein G3T16_14000 [Kineobactrum salinum]
MKVTLLIAALALLVSLNPVGSRADDIEIYLDGSPAGEAYVHLMLDYRPSVFSAMCRYGSSCAPPFMSPQSYANLGRRSENEQISRFEVLVAVMTTLFDNPLFADIHVALLTSNFVSTSNPKQHGGSLLKSYSLLKTHRGELIAALQSIPQPAGAQSAHKLQPRHAYYEWYRYLNGGAVIDGTATAQNFDGDPQAPRHDPAIFTTPSRTTYQSPFTDTASCARLFSIMLAMNSASESNDLDSLIEADMATGAAATFEQMLKYMHRPSSDLVDGVEGIQPLQKSWVISDPDSVATSRSWAEAGGSGLPLNIDDPARLEAELSNAFMEVTSVSSTFVAGSVPVNVFGQAGAGDNLFVALFEARPTLRWPGNIKKLKLVGDPETPDTDVDRIVDVNGAAGFETTGDDKGRIAFDALTFWTDAAALPPGDGSLFPDHADGREVTRGGAGQKITGFIPGGAGIIGNLNSEGGARQLFVEPASVVNGASNAFDPFDADPATASALLPELGAATVAEAVELIRWGRGQDVDDEDGDGSTSAPRPWILGAAMHSRPLALNYGAQGSYTAENPNIRLLFGSGLGSFHILQNTDAGGRETGSELFAFYPRELLGNLGPLRENTETALKMRYGIDGAPVALTRDLNGDGTLQSSDGDEAWVYFGLRRGGYSYYALDVSNPDVQPTLRWKISQTSGGDFDELGLTFSTPVVGRVSHDGDPVDVLIFAGGYNGGWDDNYSSRVGKDAGDADDAVGNAIYIINARTGALIWKAVRGETGSVSNTVYQHAELVDSIPSAVTVLRDTGGVIHRLYVGDTGGTVWRVDLPPGSGVSHRQDNWFVTRLAVLGEDGRTTDRRFFHPPDVVETRDSFGAYDGIVISSGNRADPNETAVENHHFYIKDRLVSSGAAAVKARDDNPLTLTDLADQSDCDTAGDSCALPPALANGWRIRLQRAGEKGLATALTDGGRVFMTSFVPASAGGRCAPAEGAGKLYAVDLATGSGQVVYDLGPGIPPGVTAVANVLLPPSRPESDPDSPADPAEVGCEGEFCQSRTGRLVPIYWVEPGIDPL